MFCDTSFGAKLYLPEQDTNRVGDTLESASEVFVSDLFRIETISIFHRLMRERLWSASAYQAANRQFKKDVESGFWTFLPIDADVITTAERIYEKLPKGIFLRAADCIHLATAMSCGISAFYTDDAQQARAARALGLRVTGNAA